MRVWLTGWTGKEVLGRWRSTWRSDKGVSAALMGQLYREVDGSYS